MLAEIFVRPQTIGIGKVATDVWIWSAVKSGLSAPFEPPNRKAN
jgi:hypothetical protein